MSPQPQRRELTAGGVRLSYLEWGKPRPGQPSLLYLHGLIATAETFLAMAAELADENHVLALDLPGAGSSERRSGLKADFAAQAALVTAFLEALELGDVVLVGHSHGGAISLRLAVDSPSRWHSLILLSPAHPYSTAADSLIRLYLSAPGRLFAYLLPWLPRWLHLIGFRQMAGPGSWSDPRDLVPYTNNLRTAGTIAHLLNLLASWRRDMDGLRTALERQPVSVPTLLLWGDHDRAVPHTTAPALMAQIRTCEQVTLPNVGHRPAEEVPRECARLIRTWLISRKT